MNEGPINSEPSPEGSDTGENLYAYALALGKQGLNQEQIQSALVEKGMAPGEAGTVAGSFVKKEESEAVAATNAGTSNMVIGAVFFFGGIVVTAGTYMAAAGGGTYVVAWGAIIFGGIQMVRGYFHSVSG